MFALGLYRFRIGLKVVRDRVLPQISGSGECFSLIPSPFSLSCGDPRGSTGLRAELCPGRFFF